MSDTRADTYSFTRQCLILAGWVGAIGVVLGAFGAHGMPAFLESRGLSAELISKRMETFEIGIRYHLWHAIVLLALPVATTCLPARRLRIVMGLLLLGIVLFSGSLYLLVLLDAPKLGMVTPLGGVSLIMAWIWLAVAAMLSGRETQS